MHNRLLPGRLEPRADLASTAGHCSARVDINIMNIYVSNCIAMASEPRFISFISLSGTTKGGAEGHKTNATFSIGIYFTFG